MNIILFLILSILANNISTEIIADKPQQHHGGNKATNFLFIKDVSDVTDFIVISGGVVTYVHGIKYELFNVRNIVVVDTGKKRTEGSSYKSYEVSSSQCPMHIEHLITKIIQNRELRKRHSVKFTSFHQKTSSGQIPLKDPSSHHLQDFENDSWMSKSSHQMCISFSYSTIEIPIWQAAILSLNTFLIEHSDIDSQKLDISKRFHRCSSIIINVSEFNHCKYKTNIMDRRNLDVNSSIGNFNADKDTSVSLKTENKKINRGTGSDPIKMFIKGTGYDTGFKKQRESWQLDNWITICYDPIDVLECLTILYEERKSEYYLGSDISPNSLEYFHSKGMILKNVMINHRQWHTSGDFKLLHSKCITKRTDKASDSSENHRELVGFILNGILNELNRSDKKLAKIENSTCYAGNEWNQRVNAHRKDNHVVSENKPKTPTENVLTKYLFIKDISVVTDLIVFSGGVVTHLQGMKDELFNVRNIVVVDNALLIREGYAYKSYEILSSQCPMHVKHLTTKFLQQRVFLTRHSIKSTLFNQKALNKTSSNQKPLNSPSWNHLNNFKEAPWIYKSSRQICVSFSYTTIGIPVWPGAALLVDALLMERNDMDSQKLDILKGPRHYSSIIVEVFEFDHCKYIANIMNRRSLGINNPSIGNLNADKDTPVSLKTEKRTTNLWTGYDPIKMFIKGTGYDTSFINDREFWQLDVWITIIHGSIDVFDYLTILYDERPKYYLESDITTYGLEHFHPKGMILKKTMTDNRQWYVYGDFKFPHPKCMAKCTGNANDTSENHRKVVGFVLTGILNELNQNDKKLVKLQNLTCYAGNEWNQRVNAHRKDIPNENIATKYLFIKDISDITDLIVFSGGVVTHVQGIKGELFNVRNIVVVDNAMEIRDGYAYRSYKVLFNQCLMHIENLTTKLLQLTCDSIKSTSRNQKASNKTLSNQKPLNDPSFNSLRDFGNEPWISKSNRQLCVSFPYTIIEIPTWQGASLLLDTLLMEHNDIDSQKMNIPKGYRRCISTIKEVFEFDHCNCMTKIIDRQNLDMSNPSIGNIYADKDTFVSMKTENRKMNWWNDCDPIKIFIESASYNTNIEKQRESSRFDIWITVYHDSIDVFHLQILYDERRPEYYLGSDIATNGLEHFHSKGMILKYVIINKRQCDASGDFKLLHPKSMTMKCGCKTGDSSENHRKLAGFISTGILSELNRRDKKLEKFKNPSCFATIENWNDGSMMVQQEDIAGRIEKLRTLNKNALSGKGWEVIKAWNMCVINQPYDIANIAGEPHQNAPLVIIQDVTASLPSRIYNKSIKMIIYDYEKSNTNEFEQASTTISQQTSLPAKGIGLYSRMNDNLDEVGGRRVDFTVEDSCSWKWNQNEWNSKDNCHQSSIYTLFDWQDTQCSKIIPIHEEPVQLTFSFLDETEMERYLHEFSPDQSRTSNILHQLVELTIDAIDLKNMIAIIDYTNELINKLKEILDHHQGACGTTLQLLVVLIIMHTWQKNMQVKVRILRQVMEIENDKENNRLKERIQKLQTTLVTVIDSIKSTHTTNTINEKCDDVQNQATCKSHNNKREKHSAEITPNAWKMSKFSSRFNLDNHIRHQQKECFDQQLAIKELFHNPQKEQAGSNHSCRSNNNLAAIPSNAAVDLYFNIL